MFKNGGEIEQQKLLAKQKGLDKQKVPAKHSQEGGKSKP